jgi:hypothetical protein
MDQMIADASKPYAAKLPPPPETMDIFSAAYRYKQTGVNTHVRATYECARAMEGMLAITLALRVWKLEHGSYPSSLNQLVPGYLKKLPDDPFAMSGTFKYKLNGSRYLLYSLGPDCKDNGGKPVSISRAGFWALAPGAKGDIVIN